MEQLRKIFRRRFFRYGAPFFVLMFGGSLWLEKFTNLKYQFGQHKMLRPDLESLGIKLKDPSEVTLEAQYEEIKKIDIDSWEIKRGPRPWEEKSENLKNSK